jgi:predicted ATP-binding protein involved in virulence
MHITSVEIENIKSIQKLRWEVPAGQEAGWHVIIGDNGSGKTTFLKSIAVALVGEREALKLPEIWRKWVRIGEKKGVVRLELAKLKEKISQLEILEKEGTIKEISFPRFGRHVIDIEDKTVYYSFSSSFGSFRRLTGGDFNDNDEKFLSDIDRHISLFKSNFVFNKTLSWLRELRFKQLESRDEGKFLVDILDFVNQGNLLPYGVKMKEVNSDEVIFIDANGCDISVMELSDGYRSILSITFEVIRQIFLNDSVVELRNIFIKEDIIKVNRPGVVLIDEVDAHLHPTWQRKIGQWFRKYFPNMQFIVTTHSPLICQAAEHGTVFRLPQPGTDETGRMIVGDELNRLVYGNVLDAYGTELFGDVARSEASKKKLQRLAELNRKELRKGLTEKERKEQQSLRRMLPTTAYQTNGVQE